MWATNTVEKGVGRVTLALGDNGVLVLVDEADPPTAVWNSGPKGVRGEGMRSAAGSHTHTRTQARARAPPFPASLSHMPCVFSLSRLALVTFLDPLRSCRATTGPARRSRRRRSPSLSRSRVTEASCSFSRTGREGDGASREERRRRRRRRRHLDDPLLPRLPRSRRRRPPRCSRDTLPSRGSCRPIPFRSCTTARSRSR